MVIFSGLLKREFMENLLRYINKLNLNERRKFEIEGGISIGYIRKAASTEQRLGAEYCIAIEKATNREVTCEEIRPDIDWKYIREKESA